MKDEAGWKSPSISGICLTRSSIAREKLAIHQRQSKVLKSNRDGGKLIYVRSYILSNHRRSEGLSWVLQLLKDKKLEIVLDPSSPHSFTEDGVESAYKLYTSGGDRGGIVVEVTLWFRKFLVLMHLERWKLIRLHWMCCDCGRYSDNQYSVYGAVILLYFLECYNSSYVEVCPAAIHARRSVCVSQPHNHGIYSTPVDLRKSLYVITKRGQYM